jgi:hypothetical protein
MYAVSNLNPWMSKRGCVYAGHIEGQRIKALLHVQKSCSRHNKKGFPSLHDRWVREENGPGRNAGVDTVKCNIKIGKMQSNQTWLPIDDWA